MRLRIDLSGQKFGHLTAISPVRKPGLRKPRYGWRCLCVCGRKVWIESGNLRFGRSKSCGCMTNVKHGHNRVGRQTRVYATWFHMLDRCRNPKNKDFRHYGGRGIKVCKRWEKFENFLADMGEPPPGKSIDRRNNDGNYTPRNCRWATQYEQVHNRRAKS